MTSEYVTYLNEAEKYNHPHCNTSNLGTSRATVSLLLVKLSQSEKKAASTRYKTRSDLVFPPKWQLVPGRIKMKSIMQLGHPCNTAILQFVLGIFLNVAFFTCPLPMWFVPQLLKTEGKVSLFTPVSYSEKTPSPTSVSSQCNKKPPASTSAQSILHLSTICYHLSLPHNCIGFFRGKPVTHLSYITSEQWWVMNCSLLTWDKISGLQSMEKDAADALQRLKTPKQVSATIWKHRGFKNTIIV